MFLQTNTIFAFLIGSTMSEYPNTGAVRHESDVDSTCPCLLTKNCLPQSPCANRPDGPTRMDARMENKVNNISDRMAAKKAYRAEKRFLISEYKTLRSAQQAKRRSERHTNLYGVPGCVTTGSQPGAPCSRGVPQSEPHQVHLAQQIHVSQPAAPQTIVHRSLATAAPGYAQYGVDDYYSGEPSVDDQWAQFYNQGWNQQGNY